MRPRDLPSMWVKVRPWYFTERREPSRREARRKHIEREISDWEPSLGDTADYNAAWQL